MVNKPQQLVSYSDVVPRSYDGTSYNLDDSSKCTSPETRTIYLGKEWVSAAFLLWWCGPESHGSQYQGKGSSPNWTPPNRSLQMTTGDSNRNCTLTVIWPWTTLILEPWQTVLDTRNKSKYVDWTTWFAYLVYHICLLIADAIMKGLGRHPFHWQLGTHLDPVVVGTVDVPC